MKITKTHCVVTVIIMIVLGGARYYQSIQRQPLRFTQQGLALIGGAEQCERSPYHCPAGIWTQGIGHTHETLNHSVTDQQIADWFANDLLEAQNCIEQNVEQKRGSKLSSNQFNAIGSFIFNVGCKTFITSTLYQQLLTYQDKQACYQLTLWIYVGHQKMAGLVKRRHQELALCLSDLE